MSINTNDLRKFADKMGDGERAYLYEVASELDATRTERNLARQAAKPELAPRPINTAPRDGRLLRLLVDWSGEGSRHPIADAAQGWTIGFNNRDNVEEDEWQIAGWCWSHDHFTEGRGRVIGWLPFHPETEMRATYPLARKIGGEDG